MSGRLSRFLVHRVADDEGDRDELLALSGEVVRNGDRRDAIAELGALAGAALRQRCRRATDDDPVAIWRQGLWFGGLLLALGAVAGLAVDAVDGADPLVVAAFVVATGAYLGAVIWAPLVVAVLGPSAAALAVLVALEQPGSGSDLVRLAVLGTAWLLGAPARPTFRRRAALWWCGPVPLAVAASAVLGAGTVHDASTVAIVAVVGGTFLAAGWFDPRLAVGVTVVWIWRFLAVDPPRVGEAVMALAGDLDLEALLVRWVAMAAGVLCGLAVSRLAVRRAVAL